MDPDPDPEGPKQYLWIRVRNSDWSDLKRPGKERKET